MRHIVLFTITCILSINVFNAQSGTQNHLDFCGSPAVINTTNVGSDSIVYNRFGSSFNVYEIGTPSILNAGNSLISSTDGMFNVNFLGSPGPDIENVVLEVVDYIENIIDIRAPSGVCSPNQVVNLGFAIIDFDSPDNTILDEFAYEADDLPIEPEALAIGSAYFEPQPIINTCEYLLHSKPFIKINGGHVQFPEKYDGVILLKSNLPQFPTCTETTYLTDLSVTTGNICEIDMFSVVLHEFMHVLGFASGVEIEEFHTNWDTNIDILNTSTNDAPNFILNDLSNDPGCLIKNSDFLNAVDNECSTSPFVGVIGVGVEEIILATRTDEDLSGQLSHLSSTCNNGVDYVMSPFLNAGEIDRDLTSDEIQILCKIGYQLSNNTINCTEENCYVIPQNPYGIGGEGRYIPGCHISTYMCLGESMTINVDDIISSFTTSEELIFEDIYLDDVADGLLTINQLSSNEFEITSIGTSIASEYRYPVQIVASGGCNEITYISVVEFFVDQGCRDCDISDLPDCENIACYTDFESLPTPTFTRYPTGLGFNHWANIVLEDGVDNLSSSTSTPDIFRCLNTGNKYLRIGAQRIVEPEPYIEENGYFGEVVTIPLLDEIQVGCSIELSLDYKSFGGELQIWGSFDPMCIIENSDQPYGTDVNAGPTNCNGEWVYDPSFVTSLPENSNNGEIVCSSVGGEDLLMPSGVVTVTNNSNSPYRFLTIVAPLPPSQQNYINEVLLDNISVIRRCPIEVDLNNTSPNNILCIGSGSSTYSIELCSELSTVDAVLSNTNLPAGFTISQVGSPSLEIPGNGDCVTAVFDVEIDNSVIVGDYFIETEVVMTSGCGETETRTIITPISVEQCVSTCEPSADYVIGDDDCDVLLSELISCGDMPDMVFGDDLGEDILLVYGDLVVDVDYTFTNCEIIMEAGASITVRPFTGLVTLKLIDVNDNGGIHGCDELWEGINIRDSRLIVENSIIQDALYGINALQKTRLSIKDSKFIDNHIGLLSSSPDMSIVLEDFYGNEIYGDNGLLPATWNTGTITENTPFSGVVLKNVEDAGFNGTTIVFGLQNSNQNSINHFHDLHNGILADGAKIAVVHTKFSDILQDNSSQFATTGFGISVSDEGFVEPLLFVRGFSPFSPFNTTMFENVTRAIEAKSTTVNIDRVKTVDCISGFRILDYGDRPVDITNSDIRNSILSISLENSFSTGFVNVSDNIITTGSLFSPGPGITGINISDMGLASPTNANLIRNNTITVNGRGGKAIKLSGSTRYNIEDNTISFNQPPTGFVGISVSAGNNNRLVNNSITGTNTNNGDGIALSSAGGTTAGGMVVCGNVIADIRRALNVEGDWLDTQLSLNNIKGDIHHGIRYGEQVFEMSPQLRTGNVWDVQSVSGYGLIHELDAVNIASILPNQFFEVSDLDPFNIPPSATVSNAPPLTSLWYGSNPLPNNSMGCPISVPSNPSYHDTITIKEVTQTNPPNRDWNLKYPLWVRSLENPGITSNFVYDYILDSISSNDLNHLYLVKDANASATFGATYIDDRNRYLGDYILLIGDILTLDSLRSIGLIDYADRQILLDSLNEVGNRIKEQSLIVTAARKSISQGVLSRNRLLTGDSWQQRINDLLFLELNYANKIGVTVDNKLQQSLMTLANVCPIEEPFVYVQARNWIERFWPGTIIPETTCDANNDESENAKPYTNTISDHILGSIKIFPNPTTTKSIQISIEKAEGINSISVIDFMGREVERIQLHNDHDVFTRSIQFERPGVYFVRFSCADGYIDVRKVIIQ